MTSETELFVGNLCDRLSENDLRDEFLKFGEILSLRLKNLDRPPAFAFVKYADVSDARNAVRGMNNKLLEGKSLRVEVCRSGKKSLLSAINNDDQKYQTDYCVIIENTGHAAWQEVKDFVRNGGCDVVRASVDFDGTTRAFFRNNSEMQRAIQILDETELNGHCVRLFEEPRGGINGGRGGRSRSPPSRIGGGFRSRSRSPPGRNGGGFRSRSRSPLPLQGRGERFSRSPPRYVRGGAPFRGGEFSRSPPRYSRGGAPLRGGRFSPLPPRYGRGGAPSSWGGGFSRSPPPQRANYGQDRNYGSV